MQNPINTDCGGCVLREIKELLTEEPFNYSNEITEILFKASFNPESPAMKECYELIERMMGEGKESWEIMAEIERTDVLRDEAIAYCYFEDTKKAFLKGRTLSTSRK